MKLSSGAFLLLIAVAAGARPRAQDDAPRSGVRGRRLPSTPDEAPPQRDLMAGTSMTFSPLTCNDGLSASDCDPAVTLSTILASTPAGTSPVIPCGTCALLDVADGSTIDLPDGLNVEGMLHVPSTADVSIVATHIFVQGILKIDPPADPANTIKVRLVGTEDQYLVPHAENAASSGCDVTTGCNVGKKGVVVAGGLLDIRALPDETCPTWTTLTSVVPPSADGVSASTGCPLVHDLVLGDGTFESHSLEGFGQVHGWPARIAVVTDEDGNSHLRQTGRNPAAGIRVHFDTTCADPPSASNNAGLYRFRMRYRSIPNYDDGYNNGWMNLKIKANWGWGRYGPGCPAAVDNEWVECDVTIALAEHEASADAFNMEIHPSIHGTKDVDYDDISFEAIPRPHKIRVANPQAAACFGARPGSEVLITNSKSWGGSHDQVVLTVDSVDAVTGEIDFGWANPLPPDTNPNVDPDMASEVAWLSRSVVFEAEGDGPSDSTYDALHGGHLMIFHTPDVAQRIEGIEFKNFGQQGILGRYPVHFHKSQHVAGSVVRKNSIRESKQRCIVIHGSHDVLVEENVSFDTFGHCYILEDGDETNNSFVGNLGARTKGQNIGIGSSDRFASTIWITNPSNHFIGNVCAGSHNSGIWFQLDTTKHLSLGTFKDNTAHSNGDVGIRTYAPGFMPPDEALFEGIRSYYNRGADVGGLFIHGTRNVKVKDAFFAHNKNPAVHYPPPHVLYFGNGEGNSIEGSTFVGSCGEVGIKLDLAPSQLRVYNSTFTGFVGGCDAGSLGAAIQVSSTSGWSNMPILSGLTVDSSEAYAIEIISPFERGNVYIEDPTGEFNPSGLPGFFINNQPRMTAFIDEGLCSPGLNGGISYGLFCQGVCLRRLLVDTGYLEMDYQMVVTSKTDPSKTHTFDWSHANEFDVVLPSDEYNIHFLRVSDGQIGFPPVTLRFRDEVVGDSPPSCSSYITSASLDFEADVPTAAPSVSIMPTIEVKEGYSYVGCYKDDWCRDLPISMGSGLSHDQCYQFCKDQGYGYFGLQADRQCFCGSSYGKHGETTCENNCAMDATWFGGWSNCVYHIREVTALKTPNNNNIWFELASGLSNGDNDNGSLEFEVQASNDAHIALGPSSVQACERVIPEHYEIGLGGWANSKSIMRLEPGSTYHAAEFYGSVLDVFTYRKFKITWDASILKVEQWSGVEWSEMMQMDRDDRSIDRAMVMTGWGATGLWKTSDANPFE